MGIRGLTYFVDCIADRVLEERNLCEEDVVLDGWNLCHWLYNVAFNIDSKFNGEYYEYFCAVRSFFGCLKDCSIRPHVIVDASDPDKKRAEIQLARAKDRAKSGTSDFFYNGRALTPVLAEHVFVSCLRLLDIPYLATANADQHIASLALKLDCSVMTNDSDFFLYNIPRGVIILDYFDCRSKRNDYAGQSFLTAQVYIRHNFVKYLCSHCTEKSIKRTSIESQTKQVEALLPILAASIEFADMNFRLKQSRGSKNSYLNRGPVSATFRVLLQSIGDEDPWHAAVNKLLIRLPNETRQQFSKAVELSRLTYTDNLTMTDDGRSLAKDVFLRDLLKMSRLSRMLSGDALVHQRILLRSFFEISQLRSCYDVSAPVRRALYELLFCQPEIVITEFSRAGRKFKAGTPICVNPSELTIRDLLGKPRDERWKYFCGCFGVNIGKVEQLFDVITVSWFCSLLHHEAIVEFNDLFIASFAFCYAVVSLDNEGKIVVDLSRLTKSLHNLRSLENPLIYVINHILASWQTFCLVALDLAVLLELEETISPALLFQGSLLVLVTSVLLMQKELDVEAYICKTIIPLTSENRNSQEEVEKTFLQRFHTMLTSIESCSYQEDLSPEAFLLLDQFQSYKQKHLKALKPRKPRKSKRR